MPPLEARTSPGRSSLAPVNAPRRTPKSSLSASGSGSAPQFTATKGPVRPDQTWSARAASSLPVPVSPCSTTGTRVGPTRARADQAARSPGWKLWQPSSAAPGGSAPTRSADAPRRRRRSVRTRRRRRCRAPPGAAASRAPGPRSCSPRPPAPSGPAPAGAGRAVPTSARRGRSAGTPPPAPRAGRGRSTPRSPRRAASPGERPSDDRRPPRRPAAHGVTVEIDGRPPVSDRVTSSRDTSGANRGRGLSTSRPPCGFCHRRLPRSAEPVVDGLVQLGDRGVESRDGHRRQRGLALPGQGQGPGLRGAASLLSQMAWASAKLRLGDHAGAPVLLDLQRQPRSMASICVAGAVVPHPVRRRRGWTSSGELRLPGRRRTAARGVVAGATALGEAAGPRASSGLGHRRPRWLGEGLHQGLDELAQLAQPGELSCSGGRPRPPAPGRGRRALADDQDRAGCAPERAPRGPRAGGGRRAGAAEQRARHRWPGRGADVAGDPRPARAGRASPPRTRTTGGSQAACPPSSPGPPGALSAGEQHQPERGGRGERRPAEAASNGDARRGQGVDQRERASRRARRGPAGATVPAPGGAGAEPSGGPRPGRRSPGAPPAPPAKSPACRRGAPRAAPRAARRPG